MERCKFGKFEAKRTKKFKLDNGFNWMQLKSTMEPNLGQQ